MYRILKTQYQAFLKAACHSNHKKRGAEICGMLVDTGFFLSFVPIRNASKRMGSFQLSALDVRKVVAAAKLLKQEVVGTFHSHPISVAKPGESDIKYALDDSLMFIFDCIGRTGELWKIKNGRAYKLHWVFLNKTPKNHAAKALTSRSRDLPSSREVFSKS